MEHMPLRLGDGARVAPDHHLRKHPHERLQRCAPLSRTTARPYLRRYH
jgi:hypothetical protein